MHRLGVCSWSLRPTGPEDLAEKVRACGLRAVQLGLGPIARGDWDLDRTRRALGSAGIGVLSGMLAFDGEDYSTLETIAATGGVRPDRAWADNLALARAVADVARSADIRMVTFHAGVIPHNDADPLRRVILDRVAKVADEFGSRGIAVALETGQESAPSLVGALAELDRMGCDPVGVNFDPANMILYGMGDPIAAFDKLAARVCQVHIKDATPTKTPGTWGEEVAAGSGAVDWSRFFTIVTRRLPRVSLVIEREAGESRVEDVRRARGLVCSLVADATDEPSPSPVGVGVLGLGFMGQRHVLAYNGAARDGLPCRLVGVCDPDPARLSGRATNTGNIAVGAQDALFEPSLVRATTDFEHLLADPHVELVSVCTYTHTHVDVAMRALAAGKHVIVEKPVAIDSSSVEALAAAARDAGRVCMPAMCMRFWPGWDWLRWTIRSGRYGALRSLSFVRGGTRPGWNAFYADYSRSGGPMFDLHVHDVDVINWCLGTPAAVACTGDASHFTSLYRLGADRPGRLPHATPPHVTAECGWDYTPTAGFRMRYTAVFEDATAEFDLMRTPALVLHTGESSGAVELSPGTGYDGEIRHLVELLARGGQRPIANLDDAATVLRVIETERDAMASRTWASVRS